MNIAVIEMKTLVVTYLVCLLRFLKGLISMYLLLVAHSLSFASFEIPGFHVEQCE